MRTSSVHQKLQNSNANETQKKTEIMLRKNDFIFLLEIQVNIGKLEHIFGLTVKSFIESVS